MRGGAPMLGPGIGGASAGARPSAADSTLDAQVRIPLPEGQSLLLTRRQLLFGALGIGAVAAVGAAATAISGAQEEASAIETLEVAENSVFTLADCETLDEAPLSLSAEWRLPYGSLVWANSESYAACLLPTESSSPLTQVAILPLATGNYQVVLDGPASAERGFDIYDVRCDDSGIVWTEANCYTGQWRIYQATHARGSIGSPVKVDEGDANWDVPFIAAAGGRAFWQVMPDADGDAASEDSLLKSAAFGSSDVREDWRSVGRMSTPPYACADGVVITPRVDTSGVYHQLTLLDAESGQQLDSLTLPASMKPLEAGYVNGRFTFSFDSIYSYGGGIANLGTYAPATAGGGSGATWFRFDRNPTAAPAWAAGCLIVKSTRAVSGVDVEGRTMFSLPCPDDCDEQGDYLASTGDVSTVVSYLGMSDVAEGEEPYTLVRVWSA